jgi:hypothetical protein
LNTLKKKLLKKSGHRSIRIVSTVQTPRVLARKLTVPVKRKNED